MCLPLLNRTCRTAIHAQTKAAHVFSKLTEYPIGRQHPNGLPLASRIRFLPVKSSSAPMAFWPLLLPILSMNNDPYTLPAGDLFFTLITNILGQTSIQRPRGATVARQIPDR